MQKTQRAVKLVANARQTKQMRTCCNCWHIKHGTIMLGLIELAAVALILSGIMKQLLRKSLNIYCKKDFFNRLFRDCYEWSFSTFNWTLAGDYFITLLLFTITVCILLLFLGIMKKSPYLLLPHLLIQAIFLVSSLAYFFLYAWSYFYVDLYEQEKRFRLMALLERMWLATLLLILAAFQLYILFTVIKCCLYLQDHRNERLRRIRQFEECSRRVRKAKQNGLWRSTSWGGGFQHYIGQYDGDNWKPKKRDKPTAHVKWNLQANREKSISIAGTDDQSDGTVDSSTARNSEHSKLQSDVKNEPSKKASHISNSGKRFEAAQQLTIGQTTSLPTTIKDKFEKEFPKANPVQPIRRMNNQEARKTSDYDNAIVLFNSLERRSRSPEKRNDLDRPQRLPNSAHVNESFPKRTAPYHSKVKRISISSTTPPLLASTQLHSLLH